MATPIPAGVSVVNITSKFHAQRDGVKLPPAKMGMSIRFLRGDYETTTGGKYEFSIFPSYLDYVNDLGYSMSYVMRVHHVIVTCTVFQEHRWLCIPYTHNGIGDVIVEAKPADKVPIALRITRRVVSFTPEDTLTGLGNALIFETSIGDGETMEFAKIDATSIDANGDSTRLSLKTRDSGTTHTVAEFSADAGVNLYEKLNLHFVPEGNYAIQQSGKCKAATFGGTGETLMLHLRAMEIYVVMV